MTSNLNNRNNKYFKAMIPIIIVSIAGIGFYIAAVCTSFGKLDPGQYFYVFINLFMYYSIISYTVDYFKRGKDASVEGMMFRYGITMVAAIVAARNASDLQFLLTGLAILFVPYLAGILKRSDIKKNFAILIGVLALEIAIAVTRLIDISAVDFYGLGKGGFILDACNSAVQWILFTILILARAKMTMDENKKIDVEKACDEEADK